MAKEANYNVNYDDERFQQVQADKQAALADVEKTYGGMIGESDKYYQAQIDASKQWADKQTQLQQEQTDFAIEEINQQKQQAQKDYTKEQSGAYVDWQKQSNEYGANAEKEAAMGMGNTGFSESSQVSMYNTYQNRVMTAREAYTKAVQGYDNAITRARLQNNSILAEIAFKSFQQQLELSLQGFQYENNLVLEQANKKLEVANTYWARYQDVLNQINTENALAEEVRQYNQNYQLETDKFKEDIRQYNQNFELETDKFNEDIRQYNQQYELQVDQFEEEIRQFNKQYNENIRQFNKEYDLKMNQYKESIRQFNEEIARLKKKDAQENALAIQNLELQKKKVQQEQSQFEDEMKLKKQQLEEEQRQFNESLAAKNTSNGVGGGGDTENVQSDKSQGNTPKFTGSTYEAAVSFMEKNGVNGARASGVMTQSEWTRRKASYKNSGTGGAEVKNYSNYKQYLSAYVEYAIETHSK